ncbi:P1 family peptidase [Angustibacter luteus]|uniref:P1 family peptidase n=1 Tax=Angustibacter luteus TaxID=658456 RepID=A0ABW1JCI0_9ACTN
MSSDNPRPGGVSRRNVLGYSAAAAALAGTQLAGATPAHAAVSVKPLSPQMLARIKRGERFRLRELGIIIGTLPTGRHNAITDVPGVQVGYTTLNFDRPGIARTGVTIIKPRSEPMQNNWCHAGWFSHNGNGEMTGTHWIDETGMLTSVIGITTTSQVGIVRDALIKIGLETLPDLEFLLPVVAETYDGSMNDLSRSWIKDEHVRHAYASARSGPVQEGNVGGGTGMHYFDFKGGSGTSSRIVRYAGKDYTVGVFVQTNYGSRQREYYRVNGAPVGKEITYDEVPRSGPPAGHHSCIAIVATDAPFLPAQCKRLAMRAGIGLGATGGIADNNSGDMYLAFSTANDVRQDEVPDYYSATSIPDAEITPFMHAVSEAFQEAAHNSATKARTLAGFQTTLYQLPLDRLVEIVQEHQLYGPGFSG